MPYKRFPPGRGHILLPTSPRAGARAGLSLYAGCKPWVVTMQRLTEEWVSIFGARSLPWRSTALLPPVSDESWWTLLDRLRATVGSFDDVAMYAPWQKARSGFALLLLLNGTPVAFVKVRKNDGTVLGAEAQVLQAVSMNAPRVFVVPRVLALDESNDLHWLVMTALPGRVHRPPRDVDLNRLDAELERCLLGLSRPEEVAKHWRPMHGDLTPWNLRRLADQRLALIDWEDVAWAPPGADAVYYFALATTMGWRCSVAPNLLTPEAAAYWTARLDERERHQTEVRDVGLWRNVYATCSRIARGGEPNVADSRQASRGDALRRRRGRAVK